MKYIRLYTFIEKSSPNLVVSTGFAIITAKKEKVEPKFLYCWLTFNDVVNFLDGIAEGSASAYPSLRPDDLAQLEILPPLLPDQAAIAEVLNSQDDKIDLLHSQNKTLEQLAFSQSNYRIKPKYKKCYFFTYLLISHSVDELQAAAPRSLFDTITTNTFKEHCIQLPKQNKISIFEISVMDYFEKMLNNRTKIRIFVQLQDTILPKLMSEEGKVKM